MTHKGVVMATEGWTSKVNNDSEKFQDLLFWELQVLAQVNFERILYKLADLPHGVSKAFKLECCNLRNSFEEKPFAGIGTHLAVLAEVLIASFELIYWEKAGNAFMKGAGSLALLTLYLLGVQYWSRSSVRWWWTCVRTLDTPQKSWWYPQRYQRSWSFGSSSRFPPSPSQACQFRFPASLRSDIARTNGCPPGVPV